MCYITGRTYVETDEENGVSISVYFYLIFDAIMLSQFVKAENQREFVVAGGIRKTHYIHDIKGVTYKWSKLFKRLHF